MGAYSTLRITRNKAREVILEKVLNATDEELESLMDEILRERLYNCQIVGISEENDDDLI